MEHFLKEFDRDSVVARMFGVWARMEKLRLGEFPHEKFDLTLSQMELIRFVGQHPGAHLQDVAEGLALTSPTVSVGIRRLEEEGLIERQPDPKDGRASCFFLTKVSTKAMTRMIQAGLNGMQTFLGQLDTDEQEQFVRLLEKAVSGIESQKEK